MKKLITLLLFIVTGCTIVYAQQPEEAAVKKTINTMFDAMRKGDTVALRSTFANGIILAGITEKNGETVTGTQPINYFVKAIGTPHEQIYDERIVFQDIKIDGPLASVWAPYKFYLGDKFSHCGVDVFQLMKTSAGWKIIYLVDTRRKDNCVE